LLLPNLIGVTDLKTSIIILTYNKLDYTKLCVNSIRNYTNKQEYELIVVDNNSSDGTVEWLKEQEDIKPIFNTENKGFPGGCNQGIKLAEGDNILLLNNDTIVTEGWLTLLTECLYSSADIGAVGPVTNNSSYYQAIAVNYKNVEEMQLFAKAYNSVDNGKWEERLKLIGFCILIRRSVVDRIGLLDEIFSPGNYEDDDYSIRIRREGYKLVLCKNVFIHHFGSTSFSESKAESYNNLLARNESIFKEKWGFTARENMDIYFSLVSFIDNKPEKSFRILEIGCGCGGTLLYIKNLFTKAELFGIDKNENALIEANKVAKVYHADIENTILEFPDNYFDYVILGDIVHQIDRPVELLSNLKKYIARSGKILLSIPNASHLYMIYSLAKGNQLGNNSLIQNIMSEKTKNVFTYAEVIKLMDSSGYKNTRVINMLSNFNDNENAITEALCNIFGSENKEIYQTSYFALSSEPDFIDQYSDTGLIFRALLNSLNSEINIEENSDRILNLVNKNSENQQLVLDIIDKYITNKVGVLNYLAVRCYTNKLYDYVLPFFESALKYDERNIDTLTNLSLVLENFNECEIALSYIEKVKNHTKETNAILKRLSKKVYDKPFISICIPTYNRAKDLNTCLNSIYSQIGNNHKWEVVVCNNHSTDETEQVIINYKEVYDNLKYYKNDTNIGGDKNILKVTEYANGEYFLWHGDDDFFIAGSLEELFNVAYKNKDKALIFIKV
jgi:O-antigen biosynthesis protein